LILTVCCKTPPAPPEAERAVALEGELWRAGGSLFAADEYERFRRELAGLASRLAVEKAKFGWWRDYGRLRAEFRRLIDDGESLLVRIAEAKRSKSAVYADAAGDLAARIDRLKRMTHFFNENDVIRQNVTQAEIKLAEARLLVEKEQYADAQTVVAGGEVCVEKAQSAAASLLARYLDGDQLARWRAQAEETVAASKANGNVAIVVNKIERTLTVYQRGAVAAVFEIGLGKFGLSDKLYAGDEATPEGKYRVIKKFPNSSFYKAMLLNYPSDEDRREFAEARRKGTVPTKATIGGAIEIHGGGKDNLTQGCVGLENKDMDEVYRWAEVGTPVTIVGAVTVENTVLADIQKFVKHD
jgi:L,D-peptidoglycan transpeptidase YkuD (ErfK/YbiS/YcfS/YnhG family)